MLTKYSNFFDNMKNSCSFKQLMDHYPNEIYHKSIECEYNLKYNSMLAKEFKLQQNNKSKVFKQKYLLTVRDFLILLHKNQYLFYNIPFNIRRKIWKLIIKNIGFFNFWEKGREYSKFLKNYEPYELYKNIVYGKFSFYY